MTGEAPANEERARRRRVFFALWPDDATRNAISRASRRVVRLCGGRPTAKRNLHVTVAFLGGLDAEQLERASQVPPIPVGAFELELDSLAYFDGSKTLSLVPRSVSPPLAELERALWDRLEREGFEREPRIYRPHLTLARRARPVEEPVTPVRWPVAALTLVESIPLPRSVHYEPLEHWPL
ncbi:MAG TPA: RNA 2',3'-cyclic phosphodiesterase [Gammaproteobacteria bacterium]